ncbi:UNVERIFIED_ORG: hypothetical protein J2W85_006371 [Ensifer adhaerens]|nr:hypothetical protein [Ensifer adhaerens]
MKARYSGHYEISEEAMAWLTARTSVLYDPVKTICAEHLAKLERADNSTLLREKGSS